MATPIRAGLVGLGIGGAHLSAYLRLPHQFEVVALCDLDRRRAATMAEEHRIPFVTDDLGELCSLPDVDVIDLCTPPYLHFEQVMRVLASGKHVICEKPLVGSLAEVDELRTAAAAAGLTIMPIFQYRFGRGLQKLKHLVDAGVTGEHFVTTVETSWSRRDDYYSVPWRGRWETELGGALLTHAQHAYDALLTVLGPVKRVMGMTTTRVNAIEVEDCAAATIELADGSLASLSVTLGSTVEISRQRYCFRNVTAESGRAPYTNTSEPWTFDPLDDAAAALIAPALATFEPRAEGYVGQFSRYYEARLTGTRLPVTLDDSYAALELIAAIYHSSRTGKAVELPLGRDHPCYEGWGP